MEQAKELPPSRLGAAFARFLSGRCALAAGQKAAFEKLVRRMSEELQNGHNCLLISERDKDLLLASGLASPAERRESVLPLVIEKDRLYLHRYWCYESRLAARIKSMNANSYPLDGLESLLDLYFGQQNGAIDWQREAAKLALTCPFCIITGGPGTGKTTAVVKILAVLQTLTPQPLQIALAGPTGKAAMRLQEAIVLNKARLPCPDQIKKHIPDHATTLHRLLGARPPSPYFRHDAGHPLVHDVLVVDEASMIDLALMSKLLDAVKPSARVILLGDKDQLASVESGSVLADLTQALPRNTTELKFTHRFAENIKRLASLVNLQQDEAAWRMLRSGDSTIALLEKDVIDYAASRQQDYLQLLAGGSAYQEISRARARLQVLCANKQGKYGVADINYRIEQALYRNRLIDIATPWYSGRPVMVTQNNPALQLYNGDTGLCLPDREQAGKLMVFFQRADGTVKKYLPSRIPHCETVFAMTIHKSQGSEFEEVLIVLPDQINPVLTKELLYTAITRARKSVKLAADEAVFKAAVRQKVMRITGLTDKLSSGQ